LKELVEALEPEEGDTIVDATLGAGGHSKHICSYIGKRGVLVGIDQDQDAIETAKKRLEDSSCKVFLKKGSFKNLNDILDGLSIEKINGIMFDLGFSSNQLENSGRGFSFKKNEPLLMTFRKTPSEEDLTAREILNTWDEENIADILYGYGEERFSRQIAKGIVFARKEKPIETTFDLVKIVEESTPGWYRARRLHCATKTFQALRITVNNEIENLREGLEQGVSRLTKAGRIAVITFHSIEDRVVKRTFSEMSRNGHGIVITKKPIVPQQNEILKNPRARSAKLRIFESN
jgi:16S rRNA (cytosine1402-N4)-methyltransferase